jgi:hypothetical protein
MSPYWAERTAARRRLGQICGAGRTWQAFADFRRTAGRPGTGPPNRGQGFGFSEVTSQVPKSKKILFTRIPIYGINPSSPRLHEGTQRDRHGTLARVAMDAVASGDLFTGRNVRSVRRSRVVLAPRPWRQVGARYRADDGGKKRRSPGRARISRKTIARGKPGCPGCTCS